MVGDLTEGDADILDYVCTRMEVMLEIWRISLYESPGSNRVNPRVLREAREKLADALKRFVHLH